MSKNSASRLTFNELCDFTYGDPCQNELSGLICTNLKCVCQNGFKWDNQTNKCGISHNYLT